MRFRTILITSVFAAGALTAACSGSLKDSQTPISPVSPTNPPSVERGPTPPAPPTSPPTSERCDHTKAKWAIGQRATDALLERARVAAGAATARFIRPDQPITMEYLGSRLNLRLDAKEIVRSVVCG
jgi:hypothetical protein